MATMAMPMPVQRDGWNMPLPGAMFGLGAPAMPLPNDIESIKQRVDAADSHFTGLHSRMRGDEMLYLLTPFMEEEGFEDKSDEKYRTYTSNDPRVFADKLIRLVEGAVINVKTTVAREHEPQRIINQMAKDFVHAAFKQADRRQRNLIRSHIIGQIAWFAVVRGWVCGRVLLRRDATGATVVDIQPWDPLGVSWELGENGLMWACNKTYMTYTEIKANHPTVRPLTQVEMETQDRILVYDYYDETTNVVFADGLEIKSRTRHGAQTVPVFTVCMRRGSARRRPRRM